MNSTYISQQDPPVVSGMQPIALALKQAKEASDRELSAYNPEKNKQLIKDIKIKLDGYYAESYDIYNDVNNAFATDGSRNKFNDIHKSMETNTEFQKIFGTINKGQNFKSIFEYMLFANLSYVGKMEIYRILVSLYHAKYKVKWMETHKSTLETIKSTDLRKFNLINKILENDDYVREDMINSLVDGKTFTKCVGDRCAISSSDTLSIFNRNIVNANKILNNVNTMGVIVRCIAPTILGVGKDAIGEIMKGIGETKRIGQIAISTIIGDKSIKNDNTDEFMVRYQQNNHMFDTMSVLKLFEGVDIENIIKKSLDDAVPFNIESIMISGCGVFPDKNIKCIYSDDGEIPTKYTIIFKDTRLIISFRGTTESAEVIIDFNLWLKELQFGGNNIQVCDGFYKYADEIVEKHKILIKYHLDKDAKNTVIFCGHSLGAAAANCAFVSLSGKYPKVMDRVYVYGFATPPYIVYNGKKFSKSKNVVNILNALDPVTFAGIRSNLTSLGITYSFRTDKQFIYGYDDTIAGSLSLATTPEFIMNNITNLPSILVNGHRNHTLIEYFFLLVGCIGNEIKNEVMKNKLYKHNSDYAASVEVTTAIDKFADKDDESSRLVRITSYVYKAMLPYTKGLTDSKLYIDNFKRILDGVSLKKNSRADIDHNLIYNLPLLLGGSKHAKKNQDDVYLHKYLKYKSKYLALKN